MTHNIVKLRINGLDLFADPNKFHPTWLERVIEYGTRRLPNDSFSGEKGNTKYDLVRAMIAEMESGNPMPEPTRKARVPADPVLELAVKNAKTTLVAVIKARGFGGKIADWSNHEVAGKYFDGDTWDDEAVIAWIDGKPGGTDYRAEAEAALATEI